MSIARVLSIAHPDEIEQNYNEILVALNDESLDGRILKHHKYIVTPVTPFPYLQKELDTMVMDTNTLKPELERALMTNEDLTHNIIHLTNPITPDAPSNWSFLNCLFGPEKLIKTICGFS
jgi:hypothetical protein